MIVKYFYIYRKLTTSSLTLIMGKGMVMMTMMWMRGQCIKGYHVVWMVGYITLQLDKVQLHVIREPCNWKRNGFIRHCNVDKGSVDWMILSSVEGIHLLHTLYLDELPLIIDFVMWIRNMFIRHCNLDKEHVYQMILLSV